MSAVHPTTDPVPAGLSQGALFGALPAAAAADQALIDLIAGRVALLRAGGPAAMVELSA